MLRVLELKRHQILGSLYQVVDLVVSRVKNNQAIIKVQVIIESKDIHGSIVDLVSLVAFVLILIVSVEVLHVVVTLHQTAVAVITSIAHAAALP